MKKQGMKSPQEIFSYFVLRLEKIAHEEGKRCMFWDEASATNGLSAGTVISGWHDLKACTETVDRGLPVIVMPASYCYIDMKQNAFDRGHTWAWLVDTRRVYALDPASVTASAEKSKLVRGSRGRTVGGVARPSGPYCRIPGLSSPVCIGRGGMEPTGGTGLERFLCPPDRHSFGPA